MMKDKRNTLRGLLVSALLAFGLHAAASEDAPGIWMTGSLTGSIGEDDSRWLYTADAQARYFDLGTGINQWLVRPAVGFQINDDVRAWVGYARYRSRNRAGDVADENRYWQQLDWRAGAVGGGTVSLRTRLEQRDISLSGEVRHVARLMAKFVRPLSDGAPQSLIVSAEPFLDLNRTDWGGDTGLSQYRLYAGFAWHLGPRTTLETGYMLQHFEVESAIDRTNHLGIFAFKMRL